MTIFGLKDLEHYILHEGDIVVFQVENEQGEIVDLKYEVHSNFLMNRTDILDASPSDKHYNDEIFTILGLDPYEFCSKYYGYKASICNIYYLGIQCGIWPIWPRFKDYDFEAATNVVKSLYSVINLINVSKLYKLYRKLEKI